MNIKFYHAVGPILFSGEKSDPVIKAIKDLNHPVYIKKESSYTRIYVPEVCKLTKKAIERYTKESFILPDDLELIMPAFKGFFTVTPEEACWSFFHKGQNNG